MELTKKEKIMIGWFGTIFSQIMLFLIALYIFNFEPKELNPMGWMVIGALITTIFIDWSEHNQRKKSIIH